MFQFPWLSSLTYEFSQGLHGITRARLPNSGIPGSTPVSGFPRLIATCYALHRPLTPRNPPQALIRLIKIYPQLLQTIFNYQRTIVLKRTFSKICISLDTQQCTEYGGERDRTDDLLRARQALSQLSYTPGISGLKLQIQLGVVGLGRFELPTSRLSGVRSNQLSYRPIK